MRPEGQDSGRGTSAAAPVLYDTQTASLDPLAELSSEEKSWARFEVFDSSLPKRAYSDSSMATPWSPKMRW